MECECSAIGRPRNGACSTECVLRDGSWAAGDGNALVEYGNESDSTWSEPRDKFVIARICSQPCLPVDSPRIRRSTASRTRRPPRRPAGARVCQKCKQVVRP